MKGLNHNNIVDFHINKKKMLLMMILRRRKKNNLYTVTMTSLNPNHPNPESVSLIFQSQKNTQQRAP